MIEYTISLNLLAQTNVINELAHFTLGFDMDY